MATIFYSRVILHAVQKAWQLSSFFKDPCASIHFKLSLDFKILNWKLNPLKAFVKGFWSEVVFFTPDLLQHLFIWFFPLVTN